MNVCPQCGCPIPAEAKRCAQCLAQDEPQQRELFETVVLTKVPDEITGMTLRSLLLDAGVEAELQDLSASFFGNALTNLQGFWGAVIVPKEQETEARRLLNSFWKDFQGR